MRELPSASRDAGTPSFNQRRTIASAGWPDSSNVRRPSRGSVVSALCRRQGVEPRYSVIDPRWPGGVAGVDWLLDKRIAYAKAHRHLELSEQTIWEMFEAERPKLAPYAGQFDLAHSRNSTDRFKTRRLLL